MSAPFDLANAAPVAVLVVFAVARWGPAAVMTLIAGVIAVLTRDQERGERALTVLRLMLRSSASPRLRRRERGGGQP